MGLQPLHGRISPQPDCLLGAKTEWKDPNLRYQWAGLWAVATPLPNSLSYPYLHHRLQRWYYQRLQIAVHVWVLEGGRSPSTPVGPHLHCRWQPGWRMWRTFCFFPLSFVCIQVFWTCWQMCDQMLPILEKQMVLQTDLSAGEVVPGPPSILPTSDEQNLCVNSHWLTITSISPINNLFVCAIEKFGNISK